MKNVRGSIRRGIAALLMPLLIIACVARGEEEYVAQTYNLTRLFGIQSVYTVLFFGTDRICAVDSERTENGRRYTATFADIAQGRVLGEAGFERPSSSISIQARGDNVCFTFERHDGETDEQSLEEVEVAPDGGITAQVFPQSK